MFAPVFTPLFRTRLYWVALVSIGLCSKNLAQNSVILESYIQLGIANNLSVQQQELEIRKAGESVRQAKAVSGLDLSFDANYTLAAGGRKLDFPIGDLLNPIYSTLNQITASNNFPQVENTEIQFLPNNFHETKISFAYPLYNTDLKYHRNIQKDLLNSKTHAKTAVEHALRYEITKAYLQYLQTIEAEKIWQNTRQVLVELRRFNESLVKNNVATKDVVATAEYELSKADNEVFGYQTKQKSLRAYFNYLIQKDYNEPVEADTSLLHANVPSYDLQTLIQQAFDKRTELAAVQSIISASELNVRRNEANQKLPDLYIGGSFGFQGFGYKFNKEQAYALAQIGLSYQLYDGGLQKSKTQETKLETMSAQNQLRQAQQQIALEITNGWNELDAARFSFQTAQKNVEAAQAIFKITGNKYRAGQALLLEFLDAQNRVTTAQLQQLLSWTEVLLKEAALKKSAGIL